jgi:M6 family metalloprotease-like protein
VGSSCKKIGATKRVDGKELVCLKQGRKLIWKAPNTGRPIKPVPTPTIPITNAIVETPNSELDDSSKCRIARPKEVDEGVGHYGFPRGKNFLPSKGVFNAIVIPVDFSDARAKLSPAENSRPYVEDFKQFWEFMSKGSIRFEVETLSKWISMPRSAREYAGFWPHFPEMDNYIKDVISEADPFIDFKRFSIVYIIPVDEVKSFFEVGPVVASGNSDYFKTDEGPINNLVVGTDPSISMGGVKWKWLAHETGHLFGLSHPHSFENNDKRLASIFSLMDFGYVAPGLYGWERWLVDWIQSTNVRCKDISDIQKISHLHNVAPLGSFSGNEIIVYRVEDQKVLVIENRRANEFDLLPKDYEGVFVYEVNSAKMDAAITPIVGTKITIDQSKPQYNGSRLVGTLKPGESVKYKNLEIKVIQEQGKNFLVEVKGN